MPCQKEWAQSVIISNLFHNGHLWLILSSFSLGSVLLVVVVYTNFAKAFDKVDHKILFKKLKQIGICGSFLSWLISFIEGCREIVALKWILVYPNLCYVWSSPKIKFPPILFFIFINDIIIKNCYKLMYWKNLIYYKWI